MTAEKLEQYLFGENTYVYAILDGASIPDLLERLCEMRPPHVCLYRGELDADLAEVAPYLVNIAPNTQFTNWLLRECWGRHWGVFAHTHLSMVEARKHFRKFLTVHDEAGNPLLFRYYDPRVLRKFLPTCEGEELEQLFGGVASFFAESADAADLVRFQNASGELKQWNFEVNRKAGAPMPPPVYQRMQTAEAIYA